jgi:hypothetical protein
MSRKPQSGSALLVTALAVILAISLILALSNAFGGDSVYGQSQSIFGTPINLSNDNYNASYPWVANVGSHVYVAWTEQDHGIYFRSSPDNGTTWYPPLGEQGLRISSPGGTCGYPIIAANQSDVYIAWSQSVEVSGSLVLEIFFAGSTDNGQTFLPAQQLTSGSSSNPYITPVIATSGQYIYVAYTDVQKNSYVIANNNYGASGSWTVPFRFSNTHEPQVTAWGQNGYAVADGVAVAVTHNGGATWSDTINNTNEGDEPWIAASGQYVYVVAQTKTVNGTIHAIVSNDYGATWGPVQTLSRGADDSWEPQMAASGRYVYVTFHTVTAPIENWITVSNNNGKSWSKPINLTNSYPLVGWATQIATTGCGGGYSCSGSNQSSYVYTQWPLWDASQNTWFMYSSMSSDYGKTWTPGILVNNNIAYSSIGPNDIATSSAAAFANHEFIAWTMCQQCGQNHNVTLNQSQVIFVVSYPTGGLSSSSTSTSLTSSSTLITTIVHSANISSTTSTTSSSSTAWTSSSIFFPPPSTITTSSTTDLGGNSELYAIALIIVAVAAAGGIVYAVGFRKAR